jgi:hypothetical protein
MIMKNKFLLIVLLAFAVFQACVKDEEKVFDASAAERTNATVKTLKDNLIEAPNGWLVEYYPEDDRSMGGYYFIWKFDADGTVVVAGEQATAHYPAGDTVRSSYEVIANRGAVLTFNTYNEVFHYFSEPHSTQDVNGYAGDYEFVLREMTPGKIVMTGKKRGNRMDMTPYTGGDVSTWKDYLAQFSVLDQKMAAPQYTVNVNDTAAAGFDMVTRSYRTFSFTYKNPDNNRIVPYITTPTGIKTYEPLTVDGETAQYFTFNEAEEKLVSVDPGSNITIKQKWIPLNEFFATTSDYWWFDDWSTSVNTLISQCAINIYNSYSEDLVDIIIGNSPFASQGYPGRGIIFQSYDGGGYWYAQFIYTFTPTGNDLAITYTGQSGIHAMYYPTHYTPLNTAITTKSPYSLTTDNQKAPTMITFTSVADPAFYFTVVL